MPAASIYAPEFLAPNVLAAIEEAESSGAQWAWDLVGFKENADILLEAGDGGVPAGFRNIALTVPFTSLLEAVSSETAASIVADGRDDVTVMDWAEMPAHRKALRVDGLLPSDANYPLQEAWSLSPRSDFEEASREIGPFLASQLNADPVFHLTAVGDLMLARAIGFAIESGDLSFPFGSLSTELTQADLTVGNLESSLGDVGIPENKSYTFQAPVAAADALADAGFDLVSLANNHALDYGAEALLQAIDLLENNGIGTVGAGVNRAAAHEPYLVHDERMSIAFLSYVDVPIEVSGFDTRSWTATEDDAGLAWADPEQIRQDVASASLEADVVLVLLHSGYEYVEAPSAQQTNAAQAAIDAGATMVIGHHAHVLQGVEFSDAGVIVYGLGNFAFEIDGDPSTAILNVWFDSQGVRQIEYVPAIIEAGGRPRLATPGEAYGIRQRVYYLSNLMNNTR